MTEPLRLLLVEDSEHDAELLLRHLSSNAYDTCHSRVDNAQDMQELLRSEKWDLIISDYTMPGFGGLQALEIAKQDSPGIPFIIVSGNIGEDIAAAAMVAGAHDYVMKGNLARLLPAIERELREAELHREQNRIKEIVDSLAESTYGVTGEGFFHALTEVIGKALGVRHVHIGEFVGLNNDMVQTLSVWQDGIYLDNFKHPVKELPCEVTANGKMILLQDLSSSQYSNSIFPLDMEVHGYMSFPLLNTMGMVTGLIVALSDTEFNKTDLLEYVLQFTAARAAAEIERTRVESQLRHSEQYLRGILDNIQDVIYRTGLDGRINYVSPSVSGLTGYRPEELVGTYLSDLYVDKNGREIFLQTLKDGHGNVFNYEAPVRHKDGSVIWVSTNAHYFHDIETGEVAGVEGISRDVTERKQANDELIRYREQLQEQVAARTKDLTEVVADLKTEIADRKRIEIALVDASYEAEQANLAKSNFLANMSHELRTPLNSVIGFTELLMIEPEEIINKESREKLGYILDSAWHLLSLINDILDLSKIEAGKLLFELGPVNIHNVVDASLVMLRDKADKVGISLHSDIDAGITSIIADERKLKQVLSNLVSNAIKFSNKQGQVRVSVSRLAREDFHAQCGVAQALPLATQYICFSVEDEGIGIDAADIGKLFQPFVQLDASLTRRYEGSGLGLHLSRQLVELHGGCIWIESEFGKGSSFSFIIPSKPLN